MKPNVNSPEYLSAISVEQMRESDRYTIENFVPGTELMHRAAKGIFDSIDWKNKKIVIVCGSGNNGGDGYALAKILAEHKIFATVCRVSPKFSDDGKYYYDLAKELGVEDFVFDGDTSFENYDIIVDCILGTGFRGMPSGLIASAIERINSSGTFVVCADINSGINGDSGEAKLAVKSDLTVSIGYYKKGMFLGDAPELTGDLVNVDIGIVLV